MLSTQELADVMLYPDSGKYGVWYGPSGDPKAPDSFLVFARKETSVDYWDAESDQAVSQVNVRIWRLAARQRKALLVN